MTTSNYKLDTIYALVDTDIINDKKNIVYILCLKYSDCRKETVLNMFIIAYMVFHNAYMFNICFNYYIVLSVNV